MLRAGEFLEWAEVFGNQYGTRAEPIERARMEGRDALLEIDVQGARTVRSKVPDAVLIFLAPPSRKELARRLRERGTEDEQELERRLSATDREVAEAGGFDHVVENDDLERATAEVEAIIKRYRSADAPGAGEDP